MKKKREIFWIWGTKKGKLPTSHRYDHIPLLRSRPGGLNRSWLCRTCQWQRYNLL